MNKNIMLFERIWFYLLCSLFIFPLLPRGIESTLIILIAIVSILLSLTKNGRNNPLQRIEGSTIITLSIVPLLYIFSLIYTENLNEGLNQVVRVIPLMVFPLIFGFVRKSAFQKKELIFIKTIYLVSVALALLRLQILLFEPLFDQGITNWDLRQLIETHTGVHGTYLSIWIGFALLILLSMNVNRKGILKFLSYFVVALLTFFFLFWQIKIGARAPLLGTLLLLLVHFIIRMRKKIIPLIFLLLLIMAGIYYASSKIQILDRISEALSWDKHSLPEGKYSYNFKKISSEDIRKGIYFCAWTLAKESPWVGYGVGDVQDKLDQCYLDNISSDVYQKFHFNTHNQYLHLLLVAGVLSLILLIMSLIWPLILSLKHKDFLLFSIIFLVSLCFLTENVIGRHDGVIFFGLFNSMLTFNCIKKYEKSPGT